MNSPIRVRGRWLVATVVYVALIFFVSSRPYLRPPGPNFAMKDKLAHAVEYGILTALCWRAVGYSLSRERWLGALAVVAAVATLAAVDEVFQGSIPGRVTDVRDWLADMTGATTAAAICLAGGRSGRGRVAVEAER